MDGGYCSIPGCQYASVKDSLQYFALPDESDRRTRWIEIMKLDPAKVNETTRICSLHFEDNQFRSPRKLWLKDLAVPFNSTEALSSNFASGTCTMKTRSQGLGSASSSLPVQIQSKKLVTVQEETQQNPKLKTQTPPIVSCPDPTIVSTKTLQFSGKSAMNTIGRGRPPTKCYFTYGKNASEVSAIQFSLATYLKDNLRSITSVDWQYGITTNAGTDHTLNIYQLKSTELGLSLRRTIQMFMDQTIRILIESKDCTEILVDDKRIETITNLKELIEKVAKTSVCTGCNGFHTLVRCGNSIKRNKTWYSTKCNGLVSNQGTGLSSICQYCLRTRKSLRQQQRRMKSRILARDKDEMNSGPTELKNIQNLNVRNVIQERLQCLWDTLGLDEAARKWKESQVQAAAASSSNTSQTNNSVSQKTEAEVVTLEESDDGMEFE